SLASDQRELAANVYTHLFGDAPTVGEAIMLGKQDMSLDRDIRQDLIESFVLLGDPALVLHRPN
ncbi:MAG: C25 family cysteine peptidase, partial [Anaerolineae bacterium]